ncbi:hypothetical protein [Enterobacter ludwigii]|uniref:hypothetical protein n=1 Tax=Enterobacter ludwigii TaxID=299767 RepID=UPI003D6DF428
MRQKELAATAKAFMLDKPEVSLRALTAHLRSMAEQFLTDASDDYWNGVDVATLVDEKSNLRELAATQALSVDQQKGIRLALEVLTAAQQRVDTGDTSGLIDIVMNNHTGYSTIGDSTAILSNEQGGNDAVIRERVAVKQADEANAGLSIAAPKADIFDGRLSRGGSVPWNWACKALGLAPMKLKEGLTRSRKFVQKWDPDSCTDAIRPASKAFERGLFVEKTVMDKRTWQVTASGYAWMEENAQKWRELIVEGDRLKAVVRRAKKQAEKRKGASV